MITITYDGITDTITGWANRTKIPVTTIRSRFEYGWTPDRILTQPVRKHRQSATTPQYVRADVVQAAVAAALIEAINRVNGCDRVSEVQPAILALITPDAQAALDRVVAAERERCAKVAESVALPMDGKIAKAQAGYMRGTIAHHIRKGGE